MTKRPHPALRATFSRWEKGTRSHFLYPLLLSSAFFVVAAAHKLSVPWEAAYTLGTLYLFAVILGLERLQPHRLAWTKSDGQVKADLFHLAGSFAAGRAGRLAVELVVAAIGIRLAVPAHSSMPFGIRLVLALLLVEGTRYLQHRLEHRLPWLWRFHRLHHDSRRLSVLKSGRGHVLMFVLQSLLTVGPVLLLGLGDDALVWCLCAQGFVGILAHANVDLPVGPLGFIVPGPDAHRVHHARVGNAAEAGVNLGAATLLFDHFFGTYRSPEKPVEKVGLEEDTPDDILGQLLLR